MNKRDLCRFRTWIEVYDAEKSTEDKEITKKKNVLLSRKCQ